MDVKGKKVVVCGAGKSGVGASKLLLASGANVILYDGNDKLDKDAVLAKFDDTANLEIVCGEITDEVVDGAVFMVLSPGISIEAPFVEKFNAKDIPVWSEVELAYQFGKGKLMAITGTNGKTTTTTLVGEIAKAYYDSAFVVGNIGTPYTDCSLLMNDGTMTVAEISSFQLEAIKDFHPFVSAVLNVTPDHLNRHHTMEVYANCKMDIAKNQTSDEVCVLNYDDEITRGMAEKISAKPVFFSRLNTLDEGVCMDGEDDIVLKKNGEKECIIKVSELKILGGHNVENVMAAIAMSDAAGIPHKIIHDVIESFLGVEHRIEYVRTVNGVDYYNDSKGTNPDAAIKGIQAMVKPTYLIGGGYDKGVPFDDWIKAFDGKVRKLVLIGVTAHMIAETAAKYGFKDVIFADNLKEATEICRDYAKPGDAVLLSPACASWDMFDSYEQRGELFKQYVNEF